jgi:hypothetical protein
MDDEFYRKCLAENLNVGIHSQASQRQSKKRTEKEQSTHLTGTAFTKAVMASTTEYTLDTSIKGSGSHDHDLSQQHCHTSAPNRYVEVATTPVVTTDVEIKVNAQDLIAPHQEKKNTSTNLRFQWKIVMCSCKKN